MLTNLTQSSAAKLRTFLAAALALLSFGFEGAEASQVRTRVASGVVEGASRDGVDRYLGVPYAAPPVADLRWRAPAPVRAWRGARQATDYSASCMQAPRPPWGPYTAEYVDQAHPPSEDCLYLNVWAPTARRGERLPILVWIHGGAFIGGGSSVPIYDGGALARRGVIVVSVNYRLGTFGFFSPDESGPANFAVLDVVAALRWLHANAAAFGGDADRITIAGQSAGAAMVNMLLVSREADGLFAGAISQSMPLGAIRMRTLEEGARARALFQRAFDVESVDALRAISAERILAATQSITPGPMAPIIDGSTLEGDPMQLAAGGRLSDVPLMMGVTADESTFDGDLIAFRTTFAESYGASAPAFLEAYPARTDIEARDAARVSSRHRRMIGLRQPLEYREGTVAPTFLYVFTHVEPGPNAAQFGAFHTSEVPYAFGTLSASTDRPFTTEDARISEYLQLYWSNFVKYGDPNSASLPSWMRATSSQPSVMSLGREWAALVGPSEAQTQFFRAYLAQGGRAGLF